MVDLSKQDWLQDPRLARLFVVLERASGEVRVAGGAVRNGLWNLPVADIDVATTLLPDVVMAVTRKAGFGVYPTGIEHGTVTVVVDGLGVEVTTLRDDVETDGRRAVVAFTTDWSIDARRRDFTFNALYCDLSGKVFDETGEGLVDSKARRVRFVGSAENRIQEDYLRILRYFRFEAQHGIGEFDEEALAACTHLKSGLKKLSAERVQAELLKTLEAPRAEAVTGKMIAAGILQELLVVDGIPGGLEKLFAIEKHIKTTPDALRGLAVLTSDISDLRLSNVQQERFKQLQKSSELTPDSPELAKQKLLYKSGLDGFRDAIVMNWVGHKASAGDDNWKELYNFADEWPVPLFPVTGKDLIAEGFEPGQKMGKLLKTLEQNWMDSGFSASKADLLINLKSRNI